MDMFHRAAQFWSVLVVAARNRQVLSYTIMHQATGVAIFGQKDILGLIVDYCSSKGFPKLTTILVGKKDGLPADGIDDPATVCAKQEEVFAFDWLVHTAPSPQDLEASRSSKG